MGREPLFVHPVALSPQWNDPETNIGRIDALLVERLARSPELAPESQLFVFPELSLTGFVTKDPVGYSIAPAHPFVRRLQAIARERRAGLLVGLPEANPEDPRRPFNSVVLIAPDGGLAGSYRKLHLFTLGTTSEVGVYSPGDTGRVVEYRGWRIALAICFDIRFTALFLQYAKAAVDLVAVSSCWVGGPHKSYQYKTINSSHAILTQAYVCAVNRSGKDPFFEYDGSEYVFSPWGEDVFEGKSVPLDAGELEKYRRLPVRPSDRKDYRVGPG